MNTEKHYQCRHIFTDGHRCGSPCLRGEPFCYYHHTTRKPAPRQTPTNAFQLPLPEDRSAIQSAIGIVLQHIAANTLDPKRAGLLLYGLQIASLNLPKQPDLKTVEEITLHEELGTIAPESEVAADGRSARERRFVELLMDELERERTEEELLEDQLDQVHNNPIVLLEPGAPFMEQSHRDMGEVVSCQPAILPEVQASASACRKAPRRRRICSAEGRSEAPGAPFMAQPHRDMGGVVSCQPVILPEVQASINRGKQVSEGHAFTRAKTKPRRRRVRSALSAVERAGLKAQPERQIPPLPLPVFACGWMGEQATANADSLRE